jgi:mannose-6-phosphate isomerase-like protein (cupin superfamily)
MTCSISILIVALTAALAGLGCDKAAPRERASGDEAQPAPARVRSGEVAADPRKTPGEKGKSMQNAKGFVGNIEKLTTDNQDFRRVLYTAEHSQLVVMALPPGEHIGAERHEVDQFFRVEQGTGEVVINDARSPIKSESAIVVPAGAKHDIINTGATPLKLYTIYSPPHHRDGVVHRTRADAEADTEHFDGKTTE